MILVIDASVALKWFVDEEGSPEAAALISGADSLIAPELIMPEICNATWKLVRREMMTSEQQTFAIQGIPSILSELVPTAPFARRAVALAAALNHPAYDCFYLALAERRNATLVSADRRLIARVKGTEWVDFVRDLRAFGGT